MADVYIQTADAEVAMLVSRLIEAVGHTPHVDQRVETRDVYRDGIVPAAARVYRLTQAEMTVLERFLAGDPNSRIAAATGAAVATVKWHMHNIFTKTDTANREQLLRVLIQLAGAQ